MNDGIYINDREYFFYNMKNSRYVLVSEYNNIYNGDILEVEIIDDDHISMKLIRFEKTILKSVTYIEQCGDDVKFEYHSKEKQNLYANEFEQHNHYLMRFQHTRINGNVENILKIKYENKKPFIFKEIEGHYMFVDKDGDEFKITCRAVGEARSFISYIVPSIRRIEAYIKGLNGKQKKIEY